MPEFYNVQRTASFKLRPPTARKRAILEHAFREYTLAFRDLLAWAAEHQDVLEAGGKYPRGEELIWSERNIARVLKNSGIRPDLHGSLCDALYADVGITLVSYYALKA